VLPAQQHQIDKLNGLFHSQRFKLWNAGEDCGNAEDEGQRIVDLCERHTTL
jgi:hypothetical protein